MKLQHFCLNRAFSVLSLSFCSLSSAVSAANLSCPQSLQSGLTFFSSLSCQSLLLSCPQSLQSGLSLFSSLSCQSLLLSCSPSLHSGSSLWSRVSAACLLRSVALFLCSLTCRCSTLFLALSLSNCCFSLRCSAKSSRCLENP